MVGNLCEEWLHILRPSKLCIILGLCIYKQRAAASMKLVLYYLLIRTCALLYRYKQCNSKKDGQLRILHDFIVKRTANKFYYY